MSTRSYVAPAITRVGTLQELTLATNKFATTTPDGVLYHPQVGPPIPLTS